MAGIGFSLLVLSNTSSKLLEFGQKCLSILRFSDMAISFCGE